MDNLFTEASAGSLILFGVLALWTLFWKGLALWHAARRDNRLWFVILLIVSTIGILEIVYLFFVLKMKPRDLFGGGKASSQEL